MAYQTRITDYGFKKRVSVYDLEVKMGRKRKKKNKKRTRYADMGMRDQIRSDKRRLSYYNKKSYELVELAQMNDFKSVVTLTFAENVRNYDLAKAEWEKFLKRLRRFMKDKVDDFKYISVWELQKRGAYHFHCLFNFKINQIELTRLWGNGHVWIESIKGSADVRKKCRYVTKYLSKGFSKLQGKSDRGFRFFYTSNNLKKPTVKRIEEKLNLDDVIFENMENIISEGSYYLKDSEGCAFNSCSYVEFGKNNKTSAVR